MVVVFAAFVIVAFGFGKQARLMPLLVGVPGLIFASIQLCKELWFDRPDNSQDSLLSRSEIILLVWLLGCIVTIILLGFTWGAPLMVAIYFHFILREKLVLTAIGALLSVLILEVALNRLLHAQLFEGLLPPLLWQVWMQWNV